MKRIALLMIVAALLLPAALFAGGKAEKGDEVTIAFLFQDLETEYWVAGHHAITTTLRNLGVKVIERNAQNDANRQLEHTRDVIAQKVDGIIVIPQDGESALRIIAEANKAEIPVGIFNRPPSSQDGDALVAVADNATIARAAVEYMMEEAKKLGRKVTPAIMVGNLGDPNAVERRRGFYQAVQQNPDLFTREPIEIPTNWDANVGLANLQSAMQANPDIDFLFTSSDFLFPVIRSVLEPLGKWQVYGQPGHVILGGLDGDITACRLIEEGYVASTGVQDVFFESDAIMERMMEAIRAGNGRPDEWILDPGFALTRANFGDRAMDMWGCVLRDK
jgi:ABC-type sugar transport system substrate-binding protein